MTRKTGSPFGVTWRRAPFAALTLSFAWLAAPPASEAAEVELLSGTLTVGTLSNPDRIGFAGADSMGSMTDTTITYDGRNYAITLLAVVTPTGGDPTLTVTLNRPFPTNLKRTLELTLGSTSFSGSAATLESNAVTWTNPGLNWSSGDTVAVTLKAVERPAAPADLTATPASGEVALSWTDPEDDTIDKWEYRVSDDGGSSWAPNWTDIDSSDAETTSHTVENLTNGTKHTFQVRAVNEAGDGAAASVMATPFIGGTWSIEAVLDPDRIVPGTTTGAQFSLVATFQVDADDIADVTSLSATFKSTDLNPQGRLVADFPPGTPQGVGFGPDPSNLADRSSEFDVPNGDLGSLCTADETAGTLACTFPLTSDTKKILADAAAPRGDYAPRIQLAESRGFKLTAVVNGSDSISVIPLVGNLGAEPATASLTVFGAPAAPDALTAQRGDGWVNLTWGNPNDDTIDRYEYRMSIDGGTNWSPDWTAIPNSGANTLNYRLESLTNEVEHTFEVRAVNGVGEGDVAQVKATPAPVPDAPAGLTFSFPDDTGRVALSWDDPGDSGITGYQYRQSADGGTTWSLGWPADVATLNAGTGATATGHEVSGLTAGETYTFEVRAVSALGAGSAARVAVALVAPAAVTGLTAVPDIEDADIYGGIVVILSWQDPGNPGIAGYDYSTDGTTWFPFSGCAPDAANAISCTVDHTSSGSSLQNGAAYTFYVRARNVFGNGAAATVYASPGIGEWTWHMELSEDTIYNDASDTTELTFVAVYRAPPGDAPYTSLDARLVGDIDGGGSDTADAQLNANPRDPAGTNRMGGTSASGRPSRAAVRPRPSIGSGA